MLSKWFERVGGDVAGEYGWRKEEVNGRRER